MAKLRERLAPTHRPGWDQRKAAREHQGRSGDGVADFRRVRFPPQPKIERSDAWTQFVKSLESLGSAISRSAGGLLFVNRRGARRAVDDQVLEQFPASSL